MASAAATRNAHFLVVASLSVTETRSRSSSARTRPGNPAPEPRSARVRDPAGMRGANWAESQKWRRQRSSKDRSDTRLWRLFQSFRRSAKRPSRVNVSCETPVAAANSWGPKASGTLQPGISLGFLAAFDIGENQGEGGRRDAFDTASLT